jgi:toxin FitB
VTFLLDTNVVSEWIKPRPNPGVIAWLADVDEDRTRISVVTITELRYGVERLAPSTRRKQLMEWLERDLSLRFEGRIISIDDRIADLCGKILAGGEAIGRRLEGMDAFIAATAELHGLTVITRNTSHFEPFISQVFNPWT